jgi:hypothetical protein
MEAMTKSAAIIYVYFAFICLIGGSWCLFSLFTPEPPKEVVISPLFEIGDCLTRISYKQDEWGIDKPVIKQIIEIGKQSYKTSRVENTPMCLTGNNLYCDYLDFSFQDLYRKTSCNRLE